MKHLKIQMFVQIDDNPLTCFSSVQMLTEEFFDYAQGSKYYKETMGEQLFMQFKPLVDKALEAESLRLVRGEEDCD